MDTILIPDLPEPTILVEAIRHTRCGLSNGEMEIAVIHNLPFVYTLKGGSTQLNGFFKDLDPGVYEVRVTDSTGCSSHVEVTIEASSNPEFTHLNLEATTCSNENGAIKMLVDGEWPPYSCTLNGGAY